MRTMFASRVPPSIERRFRADAFEPAYLALHRRGELAERVRLAIAELEDCCACPRNCHVNRLEGRAKVEAVDSGLVAA